MLEISLLLKILLVILISFVAIPFVIILLIDDFVARRNKKKGK